MAWAEAPLNSLFSDTDASSYATSSHTPTANRLLVAYVGFRKSSAAVAPTLSGNGVTWTKVTEVIAGTNDGLALYVAKSGGSPSAGALTADFGGATQNGCSISLFELDGADLSGTALAAVLQTALGASGGTSYSVSFTNAPASTSRCIVGGQIHANEAITPRANWTEIHDGGYATPTARLETQWRSGAAEQTASASWTTDTGFRAIAAEIKEAPAGGTTHDLAGLAIGEGTAAGDLSRILALEGWALGEGVGAGELSRILALDGLAVGEGAAAGSLDVVTPAPPAPVAFPRKPSQAPTYPEWSFTIDKRPVIIGGWQLGVDEFGPREASGMVDEDTARRIRPGSRLVGYVNGQPRWDGMIAKRPAVYQGVASINAFGWQLLAAEYLKRYLAQTRDYSLFSPADGNPYNRVVAGGMEKFDLQERGGSLQFLLSADAFVANQAHAFMMAARGSPGKITRVGFDWLTNALMYTDLKLYGWDWLNQNLLGISTHTLGAATSGAVDQTFAGRDQLEIQIVTNNTFTLAQQYQIVLRNLRVNGRTTGDTWATSAIVADLCSLLGFDSSLVDTSTLNALPFDQIGGSALDAMAHMAYLDDRPAPYIGGDGDAIWCEYHAWGKRVWTVHLASNAIPELATIDPANQVRVRFPSVGGFQDEIIRTVEDLGLPNPYDGAALDIRKTKDVDLPDVQSDSVLATQLADLYLPFVSSDQMEGRVRIVSARGPGGVQDPYGPLPGDTLRIADYGPAESMDLRISTVTWAADAVAIGILSEASFGLIGRAALERLRVPGTDMPTPITGRMFVHPSSESEYEKALRRWRGRKPRVHAKKSAKGRKVTAAEKKKLERWKSHKPKPWQFGSPSEAAKAFESHPQHRRRRRR